MANCPRCNKEDAYIGGNPSAVECINRTCYFFNEKHSVDVMSRKKTNPSINAEWIKLIDSAHRDVFHFCLIPGTFVDRRTGKLSSSNPNYYQADWDKYLRDIIDVEIVKPKFYFETILFFSDVLYKKVLANSPWFDFNLFKHLKLFGNYFVGHIEGCKTNPPFPVYVCKDMPDNLILVAYQSLHDDSFHLEASILRVSGV